ncbi:MAG: carboxypeptidase regulatory-like domain-containing protein [Planctomycetes bacterium]|nr:carboxypeptidase regulatory-like domain-containing protein [Planctomycetota bacterium]
MAKKLAFMALALVGALSVWWLARGKQEQAPQPTTLAEASPAPTLAIQAGRELRSVESEPSRVPTTAKESSTAQERAEPYGTLSVELMWWDGTPAAGLPLCFYPWAERQPHQAFQQRVTDAEGRVRVERLHAGAVLVEVERMWMDGRFQLQVERGTEREERITLARNSDIVGRVRDRDGAHVAGAQLWVKQDLLSRGHAAERSQADGSFRVRSVPEGFGLLASADGAGSSETATWDAFETLDPNTRWVELRLRGESAEPKGACAISAARRWPVRGSRCAAPTTWTGARCGIGPTCWS